MRTHIGFTFNNFHIQHTAVNYIYHVIHYVHLFYNWKSVSFNCLHAVPSPPPLIIKTWSFSMSLFLCFWSIINQQHYVSSCYTYSSSIFLNIQNDHHDKSSCNLSPYKDIAYYCLYFHHCAFHTPDSIILQLDVCISIFLTYFSPFCTVLLWQTTVCFLYLWFCFCLVLLAHLFLDSTYKSSHQASVFMTYFAYPNTL